MAQRGAQRVPGVNPKVLSRHCVQPVKLYCWSLDHRATPSIWVYLIKDKWRKNEKWRCKASSAWITFSWGSQVIKFFLQHQMLILSDSERSVVTLSQWEHFRPTVQVKFNFVELNIDLIPYLAGYLKAVSAIKAWTGTVMVFRSITFDWSWENQPFSLRVPNMKHSGGTWVVSLNLLYCLVLNCIVKMQNGKFYFNWLSSFT